MAVVGAGYLHVYSKSLESPRVTTLMSQHTAVEMTSVAGFRVEQPRSNICLRSEKARIDFDSWSSTAFIQPSFLHVSHFNFESHGASSTWETYYLCRLW
jgi:hypothetical protein